MHRNLVAYSPELNMEFMYHRSDGLWLFKVIEVSDEYVTYNYKFYRGSQIRRQVTIKELLRWCNDRVEWSGGSINRRDRWERFILDGTNDSSSECSVYRIILAEAPEPSWEV
jgi:hypothetical protein